MIAVDTNVLLRYLLAPRDARNPDWQVQAARRVIDTAEEVWISDIVLAELEWVLESVFEVSRTQLATLMQALAGNTRFRFQDWAVVQCALLDYRDHSGVDFSDCLIARQARSQGAKTLYTFENERKLGGLPTATSLKPPTA